MPQLDSLGLRENPFKNNTDPRFFYADQNRAQILESTEHLIEYSSNLQVIIGASGLGKTHLLDTLASRTDNNWRIARITDAEQYDTLSLIQSILNSFGVLPDEGMELLESLETQLAEIIQLGFRPVLLIDDAQALSQDAIRFLLQLSQQKQNDEPYINIVLFATMEITEQLQGAELQDFRDVIHIATLANLNKESVSGYLRHKMAVAGFDRESPFTPRIIDSIYNDSKGMPEKINFFANKFLVSSGKGENYIEPEEQDLANELSAQEDDLMSDLKDDEFENERTDRAEEQIQRLTEQFDEIENMTEEPVDDFFADKEFSDKEYADKEFTDKEFADKDYAENKHSAEDFTEQQPFQDDEELKSLALPKFIIPVAVVGIIVAALIVINTVFDGTEKVAQEQTNNTQIELLPLELPIEGSYPAVEAELPEGSSADGSLPVEDSLSVEDSQLADGSLSVEDSQLADDSLSVEDSQLADGSLSVDDSQLADGSLPVENSQAATDSMAQDPLQEQAKLSEQTTQLESGILAPPPGSSDSVKSHISMPVPVLKMVEPEPVIGSNKRQTITVSGNHLDKGTTLVVTWADNSKEFSAQQTPGQWQYIDEGKVRLLLNTGTDSQTWKIYAKNEAGQQSQSIAFEVVKPFIAEMAIKSISPDPVIGSDKRQTLTIKGQGFSRQTVIELKWDKNTKHFSSRLSPNQFEYISAREIKLFIATGMKERKWKVIAKKPGSDVTSASSFTVLTKTSKVIAGSSSTLKDTNWISQQPDGHYTIQLFGSFNKQAIDDLVSKHKLTGDIARFETQRNGQSWYSMIYGNFASKSAANKAINTLDSKLSNPKPWVRSFESIKKQLSLASATTTEQTNIRQSGPDDSRNEAWIWTQNPSDYTVQLLALSKESAVRDYAKKNQLDSRSVYFKIIRNNKPLYVLLYGNYSDKQSAQKAKEQLAAKLKGSKPWVRSFSEIHNLMTP